MGAHVSVRFLFTCTSCPGYSLFLSASSCGAGDKLSVVILPADLDSYTYTVATMNPYINYTVSVLAVNDAGDGHPNTTYVITDQEVPQSPSTLTAAVVSSTEIRVSWTISGPEPGPTTYTLNVIPDSPETSRLETVIVFSTTTLLVTNLEEYRTYTFNLTASTIKGTAAYYSPTLPSAKTNAAAPGPVENFVVARPDGPDFTTVTVSWSLPSVLQRNSDITKFMFAHNATGGNLNSAPELISVVDSVTRTLVVVPQTTYYIEVCSVKNIITVTDSEQPSHCCVCCRYGL
ncbi:receptor-type tyrosine-protein phosphatase F-like isoform X2 [Argopecten irradians]|uniref:receptor-type tyrosine-protein phosphatase F-like isoform X2 n=1 Tax=Argopecten irradians TaxID=31199 RepID=UPI00371F7AF8